MATPRTSDAAYAHAVTMKKLFKRVAWILLAIGMALIIALLIGLLVSIRSTQLEGTPTGKKLLRSSDLIISCTTPSGKCSKEQSEQLVKILEQISDNTAITVTCAVNLVVKDPNVTLADVQECVRDTTAGES